MNNADKYFIENISKILISGYDCELCDRLTKNGFTKIKLRLRQLMVILIKKLKLKLFGRTINV